MLVRHTYNDCIKQIPKRQKEPVELRILQWRDDAGVSGGLHGIRGCLLRGRQAVWRETCYTAGFEAEDVVVSRGMRAALRSWKNARKPIPTQAL